MTLQSVRRIVGNALSLLASDVVGRATTFVLYALVARHIGAFEFGQLSLALSLFYTFQVFAVAGLKTLVTREVAKNPAQTDLYLLNGSAVVVVSSVLSLGVLLGFMWAMQYAAETAAVILLLSLALLPYALTAICEAVFQAWEQMRFIAYANTAVNIAKVAGAYLLLAGGAGVYQIVGLLLAAHCATLLLEWGLMAWRITRPRLRLDPRFAVAMTRATGTFLGIDSLIAIMASINVVLLSKFVDEAGVGLYSAATQLMVPVLLVYQSVVLSVFPLMSRRFDTTFQGMQRIVENLLELLMALALPAVVGLFFLAGPVLQLLYGDRDFMLAADILRIIVWTVILNAFTTVFGQVLVAGLRERVTLRIVAIDTVVNLVLGVVLISRFGMIGAAITVLLTRVVDLVQHYVLVSRLFANLNVGRLLWRSGLAAVCMALYLLTFRSQYFVLDGIVATLIYGAVLLALRGWGLVSSWQSAVGRTEGTGNREPGTGEAAVGSGQ